MRKFALVLTFCVAAVCMALPANSVYSYTLKSIDGPPVSLKSYRGKVLLLVNVASKCGYTPQYAGLESLYEKYKDRGLVIVGIPANNFAQQEPGTNDEIKKFCHNRYNVSFPMMAKVSVVGEDKTPLYVFLTDKSVNPQIGGEIAPDVPDVLMVRRPPPPESPTAKPAENPGRSAPAPAIPK